MLLIGPPGSGKTHRVLEELGKALAAGRRPTLVVPTASMAEHLQHQVARRGVVVSPRTILPLTRFIEGFTPGCRELSPPMETLLLERALERAGAAEFAAVAGYPGFHARLLETIAEFWSAGSGGLPVAQGSAFARVMAEFARLLQEAGAVHRAQRLRLAAGEIRKQGIGEIFFDGFFNFTPVELELLQAVVEGAERVLVTLPETGADEARQALAGMGMAEVRLARIYRERKAPAVVQASSPEQEIEDVAARILADRKATGRPFQEYGLILRNPEIYVPIVESVFERFGIPFRSRQPQPLAGHSSIRFLTGLLRLVATGFDGAETLDVMKLAVSGIGLADQMDRYEFHLREELPNQGLEFLLRHSEKFPVVKEWLARLRGHAAWAQERVPPGEWSRRCADLVRIWFHPPEIEDAVPHERALQWRRLAAARRAWPVAAEEAAEALRLSGAAQVGLVEFLDPLEAVLRLTPLRIPDRRRNVVQVLTVYEARQWELPVVFVCGLVEKQFPRYHAQNLFFSDAERRRLRALGWRLRTSEDRDREERFLFDLAVTRATHQLYLTCPAHDESGQETLPSFFLEGFDPAPARRVRVRETPPAWGRSPAYLRDPELRRALAARHDRFSPSSIDQYLQCPFLFFAERTLQLKSRPSEPEDRIDELLKGTIIHRTIARWSAQGGTGPIRPVFEDVFAEVCETAGIRLNFRAEAMKVQLLLDLERFAEQESDQDALAGFQPAKPESEFEYIVEDRAEEAFRVTGRIDRYEVSNSGAAVVVDYKYSRPDRIQRLVRDHEKGARLQAWLYLLGLEKHLGIAPAGVIFYGLRKQTSRRGWYVPALVGAQPDLIERTPQEFQAILESAAGRTLEAVREIRQGRVEVAPRDRRFCRNHCPYREVCRVEL